MQFELYIYLNTKVKRTLSAGDNLPQTHPPTAHTHIQLFQARNRPRTDSVLIYVKNYIGWEGRVQFTIPGKNVSFCVKNAKLLG